MAHDSSDERGKIVTGGGRSDPPAEERTTVGPAFEEVVKRLLSDTTPQVVETGPHIPPGPGGGAHSLPEGVGRFKIRGLIGAGAFGFVYRGFDELLNREVAIKVPRKTDMFEQEVRDFLRDARAAAAIRHQNVCPVHEVGLSNGQPYIVLHLIRGPTLASLLEQQRKDKVRLEPREGAELVLKIAHGVAAAHDQGVTHRDLKPANILVDERLGELVITDFGLALLAEDTRATSVGTIKGTPGYMSPEQARGDIESIGAPTDVHALGIILFEVLTGTRPFRGSTEAVLYQIVHVEPPAPSQLRPGICPALDTICLKALRKEPNRRYPTAKEFVAALERDLTDEEARRPGPGVRADHPPPGSNPPADPAPEEPLFRPLPFPADPRRDPDDYFFTRVSNLFATDPKLGPLGALLIGVVVFLAGVAALALILGR